MPHRDIVVVGASFGGMAALRQLCGALPPDLAAALFIVWHTSSKSPGILPEVLRTVTPLTVAFAKHGEPFHAGRIYVAPPNHHLLLARDRVCLSQGARENRFRPAIDPLFRSAAACHGPRVIGIVLTGLLDDGTQGLWFIKRRGGVTLAQDPHEAEAAGMPASAIAEHVVDHVLSVAQMPPMLARLVAEEVPEGAPDTRVPVMEESGDRKIEDLHPPGLADTLTPLSCPDCRGTIYMAKEGPVRFQCYVGHQFSEQGMIEAKREDTELALWTAMRALKENAAFYGTLAQRAREAGRQTSAEDYEQTSREYHEKAQVVGRALNSPYSRDYATSEESGATPEQNGPSSLTPRPADADGGGSEACPAGTTPGATSKAASARGRT